MADNKSTCSTTSISKSNQKIECPFCKEEFQNRYIFNHIKSKHIAEFVEHIFIETEEQLNQHIDISMAVPLFWKVRNDFDEMEDAEIHGCLGCGTGLPTKNAGIAHCTKDKCREKHISELKKLRIMIKRKQKENDSEKAAKDPRNWSEEQLIKHITVSMRRYKWQSIRAQSLAHTYNEYVRNAPDRYSPANLDLQPLEMRKDDLIAENMRWILINSGLDLEIVRMREVLWNSTSFDYDGWLPRSTLHPDSNFIPFMCMHYPQFVALYPDL
jgi:hypothetical protein